MLMVGWKNMKRSPMRVGVAVLGVTFAVVLVTLEVGMLLAMARNASLLIDRSSADLWVSTLNVKTFDFGTPFPQRKKYLVASVAGVERVEEFNVSVTIWKLPDGGNANCQVVAFDERGTLAPSLNLASGCLEDLHNKDTIIIDESALSMLDYPQVGDFVEIIRSRAQIAGFTSNMQSFSTMPFIFTSLRKGNVYGWQSVVSNLTGEDTSIYLLVKCEPGQDIEAVRSRIQAQVPSVEVHTKAGFSRRTRMYWLVETGIGLGFLIAAFLGMAVGGVIVSQTLFGMTIEKVPEYGVLKALGASMNELAVLVLSQSLLCGGGGLALGLLISFWIKHVATKAGVAISIPLTLIACVAIGTGILCAVASLASIFRLRKIEPAEVFRA